MRVAVYHNLPSGGGKRALSEMARRLADRHKIHVYTLSSADHDFCDLRPYCRQHFVFEFRPLPLAPSPLGRLNQGIRALDLVRLRATQRHVAQQIDAASYDVVFAHSCRFGQSPSVLRFLETPTVYYCQEPPRQIYEPPVARPHSRLTRAQHIGNLLDPLPWLYRETLSRMDRANVLAADRVLTNSAYSRESLYRAYGVFAHISYLGVDVERFRPCSQPEDGFVLSVGALNPRKGFDFLVRSLAIVDSSQRPRLVIVSNTADQRERRFLLELSRSLGVSIEFRVGVSDQELVRLYNQAQLTLYAPIMEPFGLVPLESMACGTPVVGVGEAGVRESVKPGVGGVLTDRDPELFAAAVQELLCDPGRRQRLGQKGRVYVQESWGWDPCIERLERHLSQPRGQRDG